MSRLDDLVIAAHDALNTCGLGRAAVILLERVPGPQESLAMARAWESLVEMDEQQWSTATEQCARALRDVDDELAGPSSRTDPCPPPDTFDPCVGAAGVCS